MPVGYSHTQPGRFHYLLWVIVAIAAAIAVSGDAVELPPLVFLGFGTLFVLLALSFSTLTIRDEGDALGIRFGPIPLVRKRIPYSEMTHAEAGRSSWIDGWGIHYVPTRGWTYNVWGFACVVVTLIGERRIRLGSDDSTELCRFLCAKISALGGAR